MGLTLVKDEETGVSRYEYRPNTQPEEQEIVSFFLNLRYIYSEY